MTARQRAEATRREAEKAARVAHLVAHPEELNQILWDALQIVPDVALAAALAARTDLEQLLRDQMADRGLDADAKWIGFGEAGRRWAEGSKTYRAFNRQGREIRVTVPSRED